jgi:hypothetical protein
MSAKDADRESWAETAILLRFPKADLRRWRVRILHVEFRSHARATTDDRWAFGEQKRSMTVFHE